MIKLKPEVIINQSNKITILLMIFQSEKDNKMLKNKISKFQELRIVTQ